MQPCVSTSPIGHNHMILLAGTVAPCAMARVRAIYTGVAIIPLGITIIIAIFRGTWRREAVQDAPGTGNLWEAYQDW